MATTTTATTTSQYGTDLTMTSFPASGVNDDVTAAAAGDNRVELYAVVAILSVFFVVGSTGNAIVMWVFCRRRDQVFFLIFFSGVAQIFLPNGARVGWREYITGDLEWVLARPAPPPHL